ncbi:MAG: Tol biopolymer transport system component [Cryomorphaceae bacterium]|jgi:Tol biopolymer transport system component
MKIFLQLLLPTILACVSGVSYAEEENTAKVEPSETEIFLFDIDLSLKENVLSNGSNVTNWPAYDNQPSFTKGSNSFVFSRGNDGSTDVYEYFLDSGKTQQLSSSEATEYSPTPSPDNKTISFVSDRSASIWSGTREDLNNPKPAQSGNDNAEPIGYYAWNHKTGDILYWSQYGFSVSLVHQSTEGYHFISGHAIPSTPYVIPGTDNFSFVHRQTNGQDWIKEFDPQSKSVRPLTPIVGTNANYAWTPGGSILMIEKDQLYRWTQKPNEDWVKIADISKFAIKGAYRLAISPNSKKLAVVGYPSQ